MPNNWYVKWNRIAHDAALNGIDAFDFQPLSDEVQIYRSPFAE